MCFVFAAVTRVENCLILTKAGKATVIGVACTLVSVDVSIRLCARGMIWDGLEAADCGTSGNGGLTVEAADTVISRSNEHSVTSKRQLHKLHVVLQL